MDFFKAEVEQYLSESEIKITYNVWGFLIALNANK